MTPGSGIPISRSGRRLPKRKAIRGPEEWRGRVHSDQVRGWLIDWVRSYPSGDRQRQALAALPPDPGPGPYQFSVALPPSRNLDAPFVRRVITAHLGPTGPAARMAVAGLQGPQDGPPGAGPMGAPGAAIPGQHAPAGAPCQWGCPDAGLCVHGGLLGRARQLGLEPVIQRTLAEACSCGQSGCGHLVLRCRSILQAAELLLKR